MNSKNPNRRVLNKPDMDALDTSLDDKIANHIVRKAQDMAVLETSSFHHQFAALAGLAKKKYIKTSVGMLGALRVDYWSSKDALPNGFLEILLVTDTAKWDHMSSLPMRYEDNVIELYSDEDIQSFELKNRMLIADRRLVEYVEGYAYIYEPQKFMQMDLKDSGNNLIETRIQPTSFRLVEKTAPFNHNLKRSTVKRG